MLVQLARGLTSLLFPRVCFECRQPVEESVSGLFCPACLAGLPLCSPSWRPGFGPIDGAASPFLYTGPCRELILALKYQGRLSVVPFLAGRMAEEAVRLAGEKPADWVIPVPLHPVRLRERSFNQAELLARAVSKRLELPCREDLLIRCRATLPQAELTKNQRIQNVRGAFDLRPDPNLQGKNLLLVDDVLTTGSTAETCAALLKSAGARRVLVLTAVRD